MSELKQVTTQRKAKQSQWEVQEVFWKATKEWVEEDNKNNISRIEHDMEEQNLQKTVTQSTPVIITEADDTWQIFVDCQIFLPLAGLLKLVPRFTEKVATLIT